jgi:hypothetical protein
MPCSSAIAHLYGMHVLLVRRRYRMRWGTAVTATDAAATSAAAEALQQE